MEIISREEAKARGLKRFYTKEPCVHGHDAERYVSNHKCLECIEEVKETKRERDRAYRSSIEYKEKKRKYDRDRYYADVEKSRERSRKYREENIETVAEKNREWFRNNRERVNEYCRERYHSCPEVKLATNMRVSLRRTLNLAGVRKDGTTSRILRYSPKELRTHLENLLSEGMSWDNYGDWHIDHKTSIKSLIEKGENDLSYINRLDNLIPLWAEDNLSKGDMDLPEWLEIKGKGSREWQLYSRFI